MNRYAEVSVNSPIARRRAFSYSVPPGLDLDVGQAVWVPFGKQTLQGVVVELTDHPAVPETRDIADVVRPGTRLSQEQVSLARWMSDYFLSPLFDAVALMLPPLFERKTLTFLSLPAPPPPSGAASLNPEQERALEAVREVGRLSLRDLEKTLGKRKAGEVVSRLVSLGLLARSYELQPERVRPRTVTCVRLAAAPAEALERAGELAKKRAIKQASLLELLARTQTLPLSEAMERAGCDRLAAAALVKKGLVALEAVEVRREPISYENIVPTSPIALTAAQESAFQAIRSSLQRRESAVFLLHGVTGSGKTEIYLQALAAVVKLGRRGIVLVPEISLTPQTIERFAARFPRRVAVLHSGLSTGEQYDEWRRIRDGQFDVVIGARSAIFAPQPDLGLIVVDEEHEWSYKQDTAPRYHARDVALRLAELARAVVIMGSATPDVVTYHRAERGEYTLLTLPERVTPEPTLPPATVVDMREELRTGNRGLFSRLLAQTAEQVVDRGEQALLFLNRRGAAGFVQCRRCGFVFRCKRCDIALHYHTDSDKLVCHTCNYSMSVPEICPECRSGHIKFLGAGTQRLERETASLLPRARILRWDSDAARGRHAHDEIMAKFRGHEADVLIGTQMVAKGLDLPLITLVGVVNADADLHLPDFRAGERTFQLLTQVAGRAGRGTAGGQVIVQTYSPDHYAVRAAARQDYRLFYEKEIAYRRRLNNPPFSHLASLVYGHAREISCQREVERMKRLLIEERDSRGLVDLDMIGPAPAFLPRLRGRFRWQLLLRGRELSSLLSGVDFPPGWSVDIDPLGVT